MSEKQQKHSSNDWKNAEFLKQEKEASHSEDATGDVNLVNEIQAFGDKVPTSGPASCMLHVK